MSIPQNDPLNPKIVFAADPTVRGGFVRLVVAGKTVRTWASLFGSEAKIGEYVGLVHGRFVSPVPGTTGLIQPTAIFKGLKRPLHHVTMTAGNDAFIYVTNPQYNYRYPIRNKHRAENVEVVEKPRNSVFTTFVSMRGDHIDDALDGMANPGDLDGAILFWEWTEASSKDESLPYDWDTRFDQRVL